MKTILIAIFLTVLFAQEVLIFKKRNWEKLVEATKDHTSKIITNFKK
tara:strand:+ start:413 stop:553 length:141 start_codon:yes stop_codon:yes gene_type:complete